MVAGARAFADPLAVLDEAELIFLTVPDDAIAGAGGEFLALQRPGTRPHLRCPSGVRARAGDGRRHIQRAASIHLSRSLSLTEPSRTSRAPRSRSKGDASLLPLLADLAESIGAQPVLLPEGGKAAYHAAAMMAAGGLIGLLDAIAQVAVLAGLDERTAVSVYAPLARQALANAERIGIDQALSGPFVRGDVGTVKSHLAVLGELAPSALPLYIEVARRELAIARRRGELSEEAAAALSELLDDRT